MAPYQLVIFDFDGTLADSAPWFLEILDELAQRHRFRRPDADEIEAMRGLGAREVLRRIRLPAWRLPAVAAHMRTLAAEAAPRIPLFPGAAELLHHLADRGVATAIVSSNAEDAIRRVLGPETASRIRHFDCGSSLFGKARKFRSVLKLAGVPAAQAIAVGDETRDVEAARQAGIAAAAVLWGYARADAFTGLPLAGQFTTLDDLARFLAPEG